MERSPAVHVGRGHMKDFEDGVEQLLQSPAPAAGELRCSRCRYSSSRSAGRWASLGRWPGGQCCLSADAEAEAATVTRPSPAAAEARLHRHGRWPTSWRSRRRAAVAAAAARLLRQPEEWPASADEVACRVLNFPSARGGLTNEETERRREEGEKKKKKIRRMPKSTVLIRGTKLGKIGKF